MFSQYFFAFKRQVIRQSFYISKFKIYTLKKAINSFSFKSFGTKCFKQLKTKKKLKFYYFKNYFSVKIFNKTTRKLNLILYFLNGCIYLKKKTCKKLTRNRIKCNKKASFTEDIKIYIYVLMKFKGYNNYNNKVIFFKT